MNENYSVESIKRTTSIQEVISISVSLLWSISSIWRYSDVHSFGWLFDPCTHLYLLMTCALFFPTKPILRHLQCSLHNSFFIDPFCVPIHIILLFWSRSREIAFRSLMNPQHSLCNIHENAVLIQNISHHVVIDEKTRYDNGVHIFEWDSVRENKVISTAIVSNLT